MVDQYSELYETYRWHVPKGFNLASACCLQWSGLPSHERRAAVIQQDQSGNTRMITYAELASLSAQLANGLTRLGVIPGDRVIIVLNDADNVIASLLACWAIRAVAVPLSPHASADELLAKFKHARAQIALIDQHSQEASLSAIGRCPRIKQIIGLDVYDGRVMSWRGLIARQPETHTPSPSLPSEPALIAWPETMTQDLPPQTALVLPHQALIGQLPGFVAAMNWFPEHANQVLTTLKPWDERGLFAAILPTLYFGHTVILTDKMPHAANMPPQVSHVVTNGHALLNALKSQPSAGSHHDLAGLVLLENELLAPCRELVQSAYGVEPNLATYAPGFGLIFAQSHCRWTAAGEHGSRLVPGHHVRLTQGDEVVTDTGLIGEVQVSRTDISEHTDPALYVQVWPVKDMLDLSAQLPAWCATGIHARKLPDGTFQILGGADQWHHIGEQAVSLRLLEQLIYLDQQVRWCKVTLAPSRKSQNQAELWVLLDKGPNLQLTAATRADIRTEIINRILETFAQTEQPTERQTERSPSIKVGLVEQTKLPAPDDKGLYPWHTRAFQSLVDFL